MATVLTHSPTPAARSSDTAVSKERISSEDHPRTEDLAALSHQATMPPTLPWVQLQPTRRCRPVDERRRLGSSQPGVDSQWMLGMPGAHQDHRAPPGLALGFLPQDHTRGQEQRQNRAQPFPQTASCCFTCRTTALRLKTVDAANQSQRKAAFPSTHGHPFTPAAARDRRSMHRSTRSATPKGSTPSHFIQPELPGLLGVHLCLNIYLYVCMNIYT